MRGRRRRGAVLLVFLAGAVSIALHGAAGGTDGARATAGPLLGISGNVARFKTQTGQESLVDQAFLAWGQGQTFGAPFPVLFPSLGPISR